MSLVYTAYSVDESGRITGPPIRILSENDAEALFKASKLLLRGEIDVFEGWRLVGRVATDPDPRRRPDNG
jgi:hypothetical protein